MNNLLTKMFYKERAEFEESAKDRAGKLPFPEGVEEYTDIFYCDDNHEAHRLDIFRPKGKENEILPVIINVHGGGLLLGNKEFNRYYCAQLSTMGFLVFSIEFRLVPECQAYDQYADVSMAMDFIGKLIPQYNGDSEHVYVVGDSGGAYLIVYTIAMQKSKALADAAHVTPSSLKVNALGLISGMFYTDKFDQIGLFLPKFLYGKHYKKEAFAPYVNPEHPDIVTSLPPCFLITSYNDHLKHYTTNFEKALSRHNIPHEILQYPENKKLTHAFSVFEPYMEESIDSMTSMTCFLRRY